MFFVSSLIILLASCSADVLENELHRFLREDGFNYIFGGKSHEYEIITPIKSGRITRSLSQHPEEVNYVLQAFGKNIELNLRKATEERLIKVVSRNEDGSVTEKIVNIPDCFYHGDVNEENGWAAVSLCDGLSGIIHTSGNDYVIQSLPAHMRKTREAHEEHQHVIFKKRGLDKHFCGTSDRLYREAIITEKRQANAANARKLIVETAMFIDNALYNYFSNMYSRNVDDNILQYVLSSLNAIQRMYNHESLIGIPVSFVVTRVDIWKRTPNDLQVVTEAEQYLGNFCNWQNKYNDPDDASPDHWDHTFLLTGIDIEQNGNKGVIGIAPLNGMCHPTRSCTVTEATYFEGVATGAHEAGHNFGMPHDGVGNPCHKSQYIMAALAGEGQTTWSTCSRQFMQDYLKHPRTVCLLDERRTSTSYNHEAHDLPGQIYDADEQCQFNLGEQGQRDRQTPLVDVCDAIRCESSTFMRKIHPALEGTYCGPNSWCRGGRCIRWSSPAPRIVDGGWGQFGTPSRCEASCLRGSTGVSVAYRKCNNPRPKNGGRECQGERDKVTLCNDVSQCPTNNRWTNDIFASRVCERAPANIANQITNIGAQLYDDKSGGCIVWCKKQYGNSYSSFGESFPDGADCSQGRGQKYCIHGSCRSF